MNKEKEFYSDNVSDILTKTRELCEAKSYFETCGLIGFKDGKYIVRECENLSLDPSHEFVLSPLDYIVFKEEFELMCIYHSHPIGDSKPSDHDMLASENACVPYLIYSVENKSLDLYEPKSSEIKRDMFKGMRELI